MLYEFFIKNIFTFLIFFVSLLLIILIEINEYNKKKFCITSREAVNLINHNNALIIDFRNYEDFQKIHIINSINIPEDKINEKSNFLKKHKNTIMIIISYNDNNCIKIIKKLKTFQINNLTYIKKGIKLWEENKLPVIKK
jgi:rhodanese-related sulfurtransferase